MKHDWIHHYWYAQNSDKEVAINKNTITLCKLPEHAENTSFKTA